MTNKADPQTAKTKEALCTALLTLLERYPVEDIVVKDICEKAQISRAAFFTFFTDKYDLLDHCQ